MSPELQSIMESHQQQRAKEASHRLHLCRLFTVCTTALCGAFPYLPALLTGDARWLGRDAVRIGQNIIGVDGVVRA